jgi:formylglycine-generating enzyme required for sulfatase activity
MSFPILPILALSCLFVACESKHGASNLPSEKTSAETGNVQAYEKIAGNQAGEERSIEIAPGVSMTFCWCPPGEFLMGSPESEEGRYSDEDQVEVTISKGFWIAKTEVTQEQWQALMGSNPNYLKGVNLPVESVTWNDSQEFIEKLNAIVGNIDGWKIGLPTEAQWEYAARAGEAGPYCGGSIDDIAWYYGNSGSRIQPVGTKKANAWGLHDMQGNVLEWCADWYDDELVGGIDPHGPASGSSRVLRGGYWFGSAHYCRVADRNYINPGSTYDNIGFRVARSLVP